MCRECHCENEWQCSVKGYEPEGWCCERCYLYDPQKPCKYQFSIESPSKKLVGFCLACHREGVPLVWVHLNSPQGMCRACLLKKQEELAEDSSKTGI